MNEDAQAALLKTLEEPPSGVTLILCADAEEPLLPTVRSRCARLRLGPVGARSMELILAEHGVDDPALAARLARMADGRPGVALAWAGDPDALRRRDALARTLLDLAAARPAGARCAMRCRSRWRGGRARSPAPDALADAAADGDPEPASAPPARRPRHRHRGRPGEAEPDVESGEDGAAHDPRSGRGAAPRGRGVRPRVDRGRPRPAAHAPRGGGVAARPRLLEEYATIAAAMPEAELSAFLDRAGRGALLLAGNVDPRARPRRPRPRLARDAVRRCVSPADERARLDAVVRGRVQGVGFRYFVLRQASDLDSTGGSRTRPMAACAAASKGRATRWTVARRVAGRSARRLGR